MAPPLDPPPNMPSLVWPKLKDWLFKLWKLVTTAVTQLTGLTFGNDAATYSAAIRGLSASDIGGSMLLSVGLGWAPYTPTLTASAGTYTAASASGLYRIVDNIVFWQVTINITTVGTGTTPIFTLPVPGGNIGNVYLGYGRENNLTGNMLQVISVSTTTAVVFTYNNGSPAASGAGILVSGFYVKAG